MYGAGHVYLTLYVDYSLLTHVYVCGYPDRGTEAVVHELGDCKAVYLSDG